MATPFLGLRPHVALTPFLSAAVVRAAESSHQASKHWPHLALAPSQTRRLKAPVAALAAGFFGSWWRSARWWWRADSSGLQRLWTSWRGRAGWVWGRRRWGRQGCGRKHRPPGRLLRRLKARARLADKLTTVYFSLERLLAQVALAELLALLLQVLREAQDAEPGSPS